MIVQELQNPFGGRIHCGEQIEVQKGDGDWQWVRLEVDSRGEIYFVGKQGTFRINDLNGIKFTR